MHITKDEIGNEIIYQDSTLRNCWGHITDEGDYITDRDDKKSQIFHLYNNSIGLQLELLDYLEKKFPQGKIKIYIKNFEKENFWAIIPTRRFREMALNWESISGKPAIYNYDKQNFAKYGKQIRLPINYFTRFYSHQDTITKFI